MRDPVFRTVDDQEVAIRLPVWRVRHLRDYHDLKATTEPKYPDSPEYRLMSTVSQMLGVRDNRDGPFPMWEGGGYSDVYLTRGRRWQLDGSNDWWAFLYDDADGNLVLGVQCRYSDGRIDLLAPWLAYYLQR